MQVRKRQLELDMEQQTGLFNLYSEYIMRNAGLEEAQAEIKITGRNINNLRRHHPYGRKQRITKEPLDESERRVKNLA